MPCLTQTRKFTLAVCTFAKPNRGAVPLQSTSQKRNNRQPYSVQRTCYKNITQLLIFVAFPAYFFYVLNVPHHTAMLCSRSICHFAVQTAMQKLHNSRINNNKKCSQKQHIFSRCTVRSKYLFSFFIQRWTASARIHTKSEQRILFFVLLNAALVGRFRHK